MIKHHYSLADHTDKLPASTTPYCASTHRLSISSRYFSVPCVLSLRLPGTSRPQTPDRRWQPLGTWHESCKATLNVIKRGVSRVYVSENSCAYGRPPLPPLALLRGSETAAPCALPDSVPAIKGWMWGEWVAQEAEVVQAREPPSRTMKELPQVAQIILIQAAPTSG